MKSATEGRERTPWGPHRKGQVRTRKECNRAKRTHSLETASGRTSQDTEKKGPSDGHSHSGNGIGRDKSGHGKNITERGRPTFWRRYRNAQVRTIKESDRARGTHELETASRGTTQDRKRKRLSEGHSRTGHHIGRDMSGHGNNTTERGGLTSWRPHGASRQDTERKWPSERHSPPGDCIERHKSGHQKNATDRGPLTNWRRNQEG